MKPNDKADVEGQTDDSQIIQSKEVDTSKNESNESEEGFDRFDVKGFKQKYKFKLKNKNVAQQNRSEIDDYFFKPYVVNNVRNSVFTRSVKDKIGKMFNIKADIATIVTNIEED